MDWQLRMPKKCSGEKLATVTILEDRTLKLFFLAWVGEIVQDYLPLKVFELSFPR